MATLAQISGAQITNGMKALGEDKRSGELRGSQLKNQPYYPVEKTSKSRKQGAPVFAFHHPPMAHILGFESWLQSSEGSD